MADLLLEIGNDLTGIGLVPAPVQLLGDEPKLDNEVAGEVFRLDFERRRGRGCARRWLTRGPGDVVHEESGRPAAARDGQPENFVEVHASLRLPKKMTIVTNMTTYPRVVAS
jgi:hypothetical protein